MRYYIFLGNKNSRWHARKAMVKDEQGNVRFIAFRPPIYLYSQDFDEQAIGRNSGTILTKLLDGVGRNDFYKIDKIINIHNNALISKDTNNAFLNLWSIMEIVGVSNRDDTKIKEILKSIIPILKHNYAKRLFAELNESLIDNLGQVEFQKVMQDIMTEGSDEYKLACLVILPTYLKERINLCASLASYPLLRSRICYLNNNLFRKKKVFMNELKRYEQRLTWHIQRLYRVRNSIIHSGDTVDEIRVLAEHLHNYVDEVIMEIIERMTQDKSLISIENALIYNKIYMDELEQQFTKDEFFLEEDVRKLFE